MSPKLPHSEVEYTDDGTHDEHCSVCTMFVDNDDPIFHCTAVEDPIAWHGWCNLFEDIND